MDKLHKGFAETLRELRSEHEISQEELSRRSKLNRTYISSMERGLHLPSLAALVRLSTAMGISASDFVSRTERRLRGKQR